MYYFMAALHLILYLMKFPTVVNLKQLYLFCNSSHQMVKVYFPSPPLNLDFLHDLPLITIEAGRS